MIVACMMGETAAVINATVTINPSAINATKTNGTSYSGTASAAVVNGVGPFTYAWSWQSGGAGITLSATSTSSCGLSSAATSDTTRSGVLQVIVTDTGNGNITTSDSINVSVTWGAV